jgi:DNA-binding NarL/FixJ family response regulator/DNA-binding SARP family transcriptional activator
MQFRILGPVGVWDGDRRVDLGKAESAKARCVLAALLRDPGELVASETLSERVWGDDPPGPTVRYKYIGWLRAALAPYGVRLIFRDDGYVIPVDPDQVDLHRFQSLVSHGRKKAGAGRLEEAAAVLRDALALWRGPALAGLSGRWAELFRDQLAGERIAANVLRIRAELELGRHTEVITELAEMYTEQPADETITGLLMLALYRDGQRSQALAHYQRAEARIRGMLDTEPGPELRELRRRIQAGDPGLLPSDLTVNAIDTRVGDASPTGPRPIRTVIAEDSAVLRDGMAWLLNTRGHHVEAAVADADALYAAVRRHAPDVAIVGVRLPPTHTDEGLRAAVSLRRDHPGLGVLVLSHYIETRTATELLATRASGTGYLLKDRVADVREFIDAIIRVADGGTALDPEVVSRLLTESDHGNELATLTETEREVVALIAEGRSTPAIAQILNISAAATEKHVADALHKLGLSSTLADYPRVLAVLRYLRR